MCTLRDQLTLSSDKIFPELRYTDALATLKAAAQSLGLEKAEAWGTHAFIHGFVFLNAQKDHLSVHPQTLMSLSDQLAI